MLAGKKDDIVLSGGADELLQLVVALVFLSDHIPHCRSQDLMLTFVEFG